IPRRAPLPRRARDHHLRGDQRDPAPRHRARIAQGMIALVVAGMLMERSAELRAEKIEPRFERLRDLHAPKRPPAPGDWLAEHAEPGQSVAEYRAPRSPGKFIEL